MPLPQISGVSQNGQTASDAGGVAASRCRRDGPFELRSNRTRTQMAAAGAANRKSHPVAPSSMLGAAQRMTETAIRQSRPAQIKERRVLDLRADLFRRRCISSASNGRRAGPGSRRCVRHRRFEWRWSAGETDTTGNSHREMQPALARNGRRRG